MILMSALTYEQTTSLEARINKSSTILKKYTNMVPILLEKNKSDKILKGNIQKSKYIIHRDTTIAQVLVILRERLGIQSSQAIYISCSNNIIPGSFSLGELYDKYKKNDGFLYLEYCSENVFG
jgi:hypothetical protein